ncbi:hypothetical protein RJT34_04440 [Clitoria ternatea]|uniref:Uncharacterized protein n=1 Tax=Clitoria ternatea TaxID=43366 RepID=A0AAN9Q0K9_CLITE
MGTREGNKLASDASLEDHSISNDSLSFAGLVSIQRDEQQPKPHVPNRNKYYNIVSKQDPDFEFSIIKPLATNPFKITPADMLISNGQIKPHAVAFQPNLPNPISLRSLLATDHIPNGQTKSARKYHEQLVKARSHKNEERRVTRTWFGKKVFKSFLKPCRKCQAIQPGGIRGQANVVGKN